MHLTRYCLCSVGQHHGPDKLDYDEILEHIDNGDIQIIITTLHMLYYIDRMKMKLFYTKLWKIMKTDELL